MANDFDQVDPPAWEKAARAELERMLALPTPTCPQCAAYHQMLQLLMQENQELQAASMEQELGRKMAEEMLPKSIQKFLVDQAAAAERLTKAKELAELEAALPQGLTAPPHTSTKAERKWHFPPPAGGGAVVAPNTITGGSAGWLMPFGKYRGHPLAKVPSDYMEWCLAQRWIRPEAQHHMEAVLATRKKGGV